MSKEHKTKGRRTATRRFFDKEEITPIPQASKTLDELFETFMQAKELEGLRERTLTDHQRHYKYFLDFLTNSFPEIKRGDDITVDVIRNYINCMKNEKGVWDNHEWLAEKHANKKGLSPVTINVRLRSIKCFFKFLTDEGHIKNNPCERIKLLKTEDDTIESFTPEQTKKLLEQPDQRTFVGYRDYVLMILLLDTGIRVKEALNLTIDNFDYEQKTLTVPASVAKNNNARILPLSKKTAKLINTLIKENGALLEDGCNNLFITNYGDKLEPHIIRARIKNYGEAAKIKGVRVSPHTYRHTFAKYYILNGGDPFTLQRLLDHSTMNMVRKYIQMNNEDIKIQHNQFSPVNQLSL
ncbi:tyrosine-type recombinase/integrase [Ammoniphilus sp. CFH 90114]|uniref:tyrosine-type recombinase/integrase n=1 Tax=Ammoniphilus sp. CFH 90114 TaxID=2493665 RepID=UPI00100E5A7C|nr:tyrosine-type recombinase/integrase [Ammoniphilus sp. CFH 90114]RXT03551.1 integrase [Ammoniphilus sp. CFH 90114]